MTHWWEQDTLVDVCVDSACYIEAWEENPNSYWRLLAIGGRPFIRGCDNLWYWRNGRNNTDELAKRYYAQIKGFGPRLSSANFTKLDRAQAMALYREFHAAQKRDE